MAEPADPVTWLALDVIEAQLKTITVAGGYFTDLGEAPFHRERDQLHDVAGPFSLLVATSVDAVPESSGRRVEVSRMQWSFEHASLRAGLAADVGPDRQAHRVRADIVRAMQDGLQASQQFRISNLRIDGCEITGDTDSGGAAVVITQVTGSVDVTETKQPATP